MQVRFYLYELLSIFYIIYFSVICIMYYKCIIIYIMHIYVMDMYY